MGLNNWILKCLKMLRPRGYFHIVHRAQRLGSIVRTLEDKCGDIVVLPVFPRKDSKDAGRVIISCRKGAKVKQLFCVALIFIVIQRKRVYESCV